MPSQKPSRAIPHVRPNRFHGENGKGGTALWQALENLPVDELRALWITPWKNRGYGVGCCSVCEVLLFALFVHAILRFLGRPVLARPVSFFVLQLNMLRSKLHTSQKTSPKPAQ